MREKLATVICALMVLMAVLLGVGKLTGGGTYTVLSGSMEPAIPTGSLIYVRPVKAETLKEGDTITFAISQDMVATHRIVEVMPDASEEGVIWFRTKGDANDTADAVPVHSKNVIGVPTLTIPYVGYAVNTLQTPMGKIFAGIIVAVLLLMGIVPAFYKKNRTSEEEE